MWIEGKSKESSWWAKKTPVCYEVLSSEAQCKYFMRIIKKKKKKKAEVQLWLQDLPPRK
jgi:hypothetical protein